MFHGACLGFIFNVLGDDDDVFACIHDQTILL